MSEEKRESVAMFRYGLISEFIHAKQPRGAQKARMREIAEHTYHVPWQAEAYRVTVPRMKRWLSAYRRRGLDGLKDKARKDRGECKAIDPLLQARLVAVKREQPSMSIPVLICALEDSGEAPLGLLKSSTVHRLLQAHGLSGRPGLDPGQKPQRLPYRYAWPHELWLGDVMHGRVEIAERKVYLVAFIDSASRAIMHAAFTFDEGALSILGVLREAIRVRGIPKRLYVDHGSAFVDSRLQRTCAHLGIHHLLTPVGDGAAKGAIERWFLGVRRQFERYLGPDDLVDIDTLNSLLWRWIHSTYHRRPHAGINGEQPWERFLRLLAEIEHRRITPDFDWEALWLTRAERTVRRDGTVQLKGHALEVPPTVSRKKVELRYLEDRLPEGVQVWIDDKLIGPACAVNLEANTKRRRWRPKESSKAPQGAGSLDPLARARSTWSPNNDGEDKS